MEWEAYDSLDPIGSWRDDYRMAYLSSLITNLVLSVHGKKGVQFTTPTKYMPEWDKIGQKEEPMKQSVEDMKAFALNFAKVHNSQFKKEERVNQRPLRLGRPNKYAGL